MNTVPPRRRGTVKDYDRNTGRGTITDDVSGADYPFDATQLRWDKPGSPAPRKSYSFDVSSDIDGRQCAARLEIT